MPIVDLTCPSCRREFTTLVGMTADSSEDCPDCHVPCKRGIGSFAQVVSANLHTMDPKERTWALRNRKRIEAQAHAAIAEGRDPDEAVQYKVPKNTGLAEEFKPKV